MEGGYVDDYLEESPSPYNVLIPVESSTRPKPKIEAVGTHRRTFSQPARTASPPAQGYDPNVPSLPEDSSYSAPPISANETKGGYATYNEPGSLYSEVIPQSTGDEESDEIELKPGRGYPKDWNKEFQNILDIENDAEKYEKLSRLANDFVKVAKKYGTIILEECRLPDAAKTIKPVNIGGIAGGEKYIYHGILFKLANDWQGIYGGDSYAIKAAGHELKSVVKYFAHSKLRVPLLALIDYLGMRLVATTILPIGSDTLVYGSSDGGRTMHNSVPQVSELMKQAALRLNIKGHLAGLGPSQTFIHSPADIECHVGTDGHFYLLDFARTFPPQAPVPLQKPRPQHLYNLLRPEFVRSYVVPLSSDAFTRFGTHDSDIHNGEVAQATEKLLEEVVPKTSVKVAEFYYQQKQVNPSMKSAELRMIQLIHSAGVNCRLLGRIRSHLHDDQVKSFVLQECFARIIKNQLRSRLRRVSKIQASSEDVLEDFVYQKEVLDYLNMVLGWKGEESKKFWNETMKKKLKTHFIRCLTEEEEAEDFDLFSSADLFVIFRRVSEIAAIKFTKTSLKSLYHFPKHFELVPSDIKGMLVKVKKMNLVSVAQAASLIHSVKKLQSKANSERIWNTAQDLFEEALSVSPGETHIVTLYGKLLIQKCVESKMMNEEIHQTLRTAFDMLKRSSDVDSVFTLVQAIYDIIVDHYQNVFKDFHQIFITADAILSKLQQTKMDQIYDSSFELAFDCCEYVQGRGSHVAEVLLYWARLRILEGKIHRNYFILKEAGEKFKEALRNDPTLFPAVPSGWIIDLDNFDAACVLEFLDVCPDLSIIDAKTVFSLGNFGLAKIFENMHDVVKKVNLSGQNSNFVEIEKNHVDAMIEKLVLCSNLEELRTDIPGDFSNVLVTCSKLKVFEARSTLENLEVPEGTTLPLTEFSARFAEDIVACLSKLNPSTLTKLVLHQNQYSPDCHLQVVKFSNLEHLEIQGFGSAQTLTAENVEEFAKTFPNLRQLHLPSYGLKLTDETIECLSQLANLEQLNLNAQRNISSETLKKVARLKKLKDLSLDETNASDDVFEAISENCHLLEQLSAGRTSITDQGLLHIAHGCPNLKRLQLSEGPLSSAPFEKLFTECKGLVDLNLFALLCVDDSIFEHLKKLDKIETVNIGYLPQLTDQGFASFFKDPPLSLRVFILQAMSFSKELVEEKKEVWKGKIFIGEPA